MKNSVPYGVEMRDQVMRRSMWYLQHGENDCKRDERHGEKVFSYLLHEETVIFLILKRNDESALENGQKARWFSRVIRFDVTFENGNTNLRRKINSELDSYGRR
jgi:hypothetical protein